MRVFIGYCSLADHEICCFLCVCCLVYIIIKKYTLSYNSASDMAIIPTNSDEFKLKIIASWY